MAKRDSRAAPTIREFDFERKPFYSPTEIARILGLSSQTILDRIHAGELYAVRISERTYRVPLAAFMQFLGVPPQIRRVVRHVKRLPGWDRELAREHRSSKA